MLQNRMFLDLLNVSHIHSLFLQAFYLLKFLLQIIDLQLELKHLYRNQILSAHVILLISILQKVLQNRNQISRRHLCCYLGQQLKLVIQIQLDYLIQNQISFFFNRRFLEQLEVKIPLLGLQSQIGLPFHSIWYLHARLATFQVKHQLRSQISPSPIEYCLSQQHFLLVAMLSSHPQFWLH